MRVTRRLWQLFKLPSTYEPVRTGQKQLPLAVAFDRWKQLWQGNRLQQIQDELIELMLPESNLENHSIKKGQAKVDIGDGNWINEINFEITNDSSAPTKHIVFIHGYGASLGCFARNFQLINQFNDKKENYKIHFLDNLTFGLSSNPKVPNQHVNRWNINRCVPVKLIDPDQPTDRSKLHNKYYKLIKGFEVPPSEFKQYQSYFTPIVKDLESFYTGAIDKWRNLVGLDKIDYLVGHSYGGYWSASYGVRFPDRLNNLILLLPVGVERHVHAVTNDTITEGVMEPSLDTTSYRFLTRLPILPKKQMDQWYWKAPFLPRLLKFLGPWGYRYYYNLWFPKLFKINKLVAKMGGPEKVMKSNNDLVYGRKPEVEKIIDYLFNSITNGTNSDIYIKNLLTPAIVAKWPLMDKYRDYLAAKPKDTFNIHFVYGQYDFMNGEAGSVLADYIKEHPSFDKEVSFSRIPEGGHNLYIDNPWDTNDLIHDIVEKSK